MYLNVVASWGECWGECLKGALNMVKVASDSSNNGQKSPNPPRHEVFRYDMLRISPQPCATTPDRLYSEPGTFG